MPRAPDPTPENTERRRLPLRAPKTTELDSRSSICPYGPSALGSPHLHVFEIIARRNAGGVAERRVVEVDPRAGGRTVEQKDVRLGARIQAAVRILGTIALDRVER